MQIAVAIWVLILVSACGVVPGVLPGGAVVDGPPAPFPECQAERYAFVGESSLAALGLNEFAGPEAGRTGMIWVTADPVVVDMGPGPGAVPPQPSRMMCAEWPDGSGMAAPVSDDWQPPVTNAAPAAAPFPLAPVLGVVLLVVLTGVSFLAFRDGSRTEG
ncbi:MAG: hypothetical protein ABR593_11720 [Candidatus Limnocylindria bacterium]